MKPYPRSERVGELLLQEISQLLRRSIKDPRLDKVLVTDVRMTRDLRLARVYFSLQGEPERIERALSGFNSAKGFLKRELASRVGLRYMPDIEFYYDESFDYGDRIEALLRSLKTENGSDPGGAAEEEP
jgi:ribosome-binding factor A